MWINAKKVSPPENKIVLFCDLKRHKTIIKAQFGIRHYVKEGQHTSWHQGDDFINYLDDGQFWREIPALLKRR